MSGFAREQEEKTGASPLTTAGTPRCTDVRGARSAARTPFSPGERSPSSDQKWPMCKRVKTRYPNCLCVGGAAAASRLAGYLPGS